MSIQAGPSNHQTDHAAHALRRLWPTVLALRHARLAALTPLAVAALYFVISAAWILVSDSVLLVLFRNNDALLTAGQTNKGLLFVGLSAAIIYLLHRYAQQAATTAARELATVRRMQTAILDALPDLVVTLDPEGRVTSANLAVVRTGGYTSDEIIGRPMQDFLAPPDRRRALEALSSLMRGQSIGLRATLLRKDGSTLPFEFQGMPVKDVSGRITAAVVSGSDVSRRIEVESKLRFHLQGLEATLQQTIIAIATLVEKRDRYVAGHQERVTKLALAIADGMELDPHRREGLRLAGICHDIGKIQIPSEILSKPSALTDAEFAMIKVHPDVGYEILSKIDFPWPIAEIVRQHHERYDGTGYPQGLVGEQILLEARILAVADTIEAMTSHRPYRPGLGLDVALAHIRDSRGTLFDPAAVDVCLALFEKKRFEFAA
ncbi:MAG: HD domain-containing phosphohydrolase [Pseudomonadota bacterium]